VTGVQTCALPISFPEKRTQNKYQINFTKESVLDIYSEFCLIVSVT